MREGAPSQPKVGVKRGRQIVYDSEDEEEDANAQNLHLYIKPIIFKNILLLLFML